MAVDNGKVAELGARLSVANQALNDATRVYSSSPEFREAMREQGELRNAIEKAAAGVPAVAGFEAQMRALHQQMSDLQKGRLEAVVKFVADNPQLNLVLPLTLPEVVRKSPAVAAAVKARDDLVEQLREALKG